MKVLLIAGGGTLGTHTSRELLKLGFDVDVLALEHSDFSDPHLRYIQARVDDAYLDAFFAENRYDAIVDFIHYPDPTVYPARCKKLLNNTQQLIFLSSYRIYADCQHPIRETSPQLAEVCRDDAFLQEYDHYGLSKSRNEAILRDSGRSNWTVVRPLISFSHFRFDLITQGANTLLTRPAQGKPILLPAAAADLTAGLTWAGNTGKMIAHLVLNDAAMGEAYTLGTGERHSWREVAGYYTELTGAEFVWVDTETYLEHATRNLPHDRIILCYDRLYDRQVDNAKIRSATGLDSADFTCVRDALAAELESARLHPDARLAMILNSPTAVEINRRMDAYLHL